MGARAFDGGLIVRYAMSHHPAAWTLDRTIPSELDAGHRVLEELLTRLGAENWSSRDIFGIRLALEEAVVNAIKHGNRLDANKQVHVICKSTSEKIWIKVSDQGPGFDPAAVPDCTDAEHIDAPNGRGIMLMRNFMNRVEYNECGNVVTMEKLRSSGD
jgi:serine/threonine-protein kinase RsbW